jgi:hypothetical protein
VDVIAGLCSAAKLGQDAYQGNRSRGEAPMSTLRFNLEQLEPIIEWAQRQQPGYYPYTTDPAPRGLLFVKDQGIYLMANTNTRQLREDGTWTVVCYAEHYGPDADWWKVREAAGGDDFAEFLPLELMVNAIAAAPEDQWLVIEFDPESDSFTMTTAP